MTTTMIVLVFYLSGSITEFMGHHETSEGWSIMGISGCLQMKRTLARNNWSPNVDGKTKYTCEQRVVEVKPNWEGKDVVTRIVK